MSQDKKQKNGSDQKKEAQKEQELAEIKLKHDAEAEASEGNVLENDDAEKNDPGKERLDKEKLDKKKPENSEKDTLAENIDPLVETEEDFVESELPDVLEELAVESNVTVVKSKFAVFLSVLSLLSIAALAYGGYYLWQQQQQQTQNIKQQQQTINEIVETHDFSSSIKDIRSNLNKQMEQIGNVGKQVDVKINKISKDTSAKIGSEVVRLERELDKEKGRRRGLERDIDRLMDIAAKNKLDWALAEVHYLATIANNRLTFNKDLTTAIAALETANEKIRRQQDQRLYSVRQRIVDDINALKAVKLPPLVKIAEMLNEIEMKIRELPVPKPQIGLASGIIEPKATDKQDPTQGEASQEGMGVWRKKVNRAISTFKDTLKDYVVIHHDTEKVVPIMNPETREYLNQNLELKIQTMRISLANRDQQLFSSNLNIIESWVNRYFDKNDPKVLDTVKQIWELKKVELNPQLPNISATIDIILAEKSSIQRAEEKKATATGQ